MEILSIKDKVAQKSLEKLDIPGIEKMKEKLTGQCVFMFTNMSPFKLNVLLAKNKILLTARGGDIASIDVIVPPKNTGIAPGPMLTEFKENKIPTKIDQGTIWILKETTPVKKGEVISTKLAALLGKLDIKPIEAKIVLNSALSEGILFAEEELVVDVDKFKEKLIQAAQEAKSLSIEIGYITPDNAQGPNFKSGTICTFSFQLNLVFLLMKQKSRYFKRLMHKHKILHLNCLMNQRLMLLLRKQMQNQRLMLLLRKQMQNQRLMLLLRKQMQTKIIVF